jgi:membrane protein
VVERSSGIKPLLTPPVVFVPRGRLSPQLEAGAPFGRRFFRGVVRLAEGIYHHDDIFHMAPAMAFHFFLSLLPLLVFAGYVVGRVAQTQGVAVVLGLILENLPASARGIISHEVRQLAAADRVAPLAAIGFLWIASGGTQGLMQGIERVVGAPRRAWWRQRLLALAWVLGTLVAFAIASFGIIQWDEVVNAADGALTDPPSLQHEAPPGPEASAAPTAAEDRASHGLEQAKRGLRILREGGQRVLAIVMSLVVAAFGLGAFYQFSVAHSKQVRRRVLPGAFLALGLVVVISWGFGLYVRTLASYTVYYGSLAAIAVLLIWLWLLSVAILVGAELNSQLEGLRD